MSDIETIINDDVDDKPMLSPWAAAALRDFYAEQERVLAEGTTSTSEIQEDWQLSQFWYDDATAKTLAKEALRLCKAGDTIACVSCPTVYRKLHFLNIGSAVRLRLFEYDRRFASLVDVGEDDFVYYDYNEPRRLPDDCRSACRVVLADPPFLSDECLIKTLETVALLTNDKVILCTGAIMEDTVVGHPNLNLKTCKFEPHHAKNLANEFKCFANYDLDSHIVVDEKEPKVTNQRT